MHYNKLSAPQQEAASVTRMLRASGVLNTATGAVVISIPATRHLIEGAGRHGTIGVMGWSIMNIRTRMVSLDTEIGHLVVILPPNASLSRLQRAHGVVVTFAAIMNDASAASTSIAFASQSVANDAS